MSGTKRNYDGTDKRKHVALKILQKVEIIKKLASGASVKFLAKEYGISDRTIYDIRKNKEKILTFYAASDSNSGISERKTIRAAKSEDLDNVIYEWFKQRRSEGIPITGPLLKERAKELHAQLNIPEPCNFSSGWLTSFKQRHGIRYLKACGEKLSADNNAAEDFVENFADFVRNENLSPEQIYNADETGLFWRCFPRETFVCAEEKQTAGYKQSKERVTVLVCSNAAGTHRCKLLLISKSASPRSFSGIKNLPVIYKNNKKAWITRDLMADWFQNSFVKEARAHCSKTGLPSDCKILLLLDNCAAHPDNLEEDNVSVLFLPPNTTSLIQPMDQGIIHSVKTKYRTEYLRRAIALNQVNIAEYSKCFTLKDCVFLIAEAWNSLSQATLVNAWHNLWPSSLFIDTESSQDLDFSGFRISCAKEKSTELLSYAKNTLENIPVFLEEQGLVEWLQCKDEAPVTQSLTDEEIIASVLNPSNANSDTESDEEEIRVSHGEGLALGYKYLEFLQKQSYVSEQEIMTIQRLQKKIIDNKPKLKQTQLHF